MDIPTQDGLSQHNNKLTQALAQLSDHPDFKVLKAALKDEAESVVETMLAQGAGMREYERGEKAGMVRAFRNLLDLAESAPRILAEAQEQGEHNG